MLQPCEIKSINDAFIDRGGVFLRKGITTAGEFIIEEKGKYFSWRTRLTFSSERLRNANYDYLTRKRKQFFKADPE